MKRRLRTATAVLLSAAILSSCSLPAAGTDNGGETSPETDPVRVSVTEQTVGSVNETEAAVPSQTVITTESSSAATAEETSSETTEVIMPDDMEGEVLSPEDMNAFFASTADTYLMSSGAGGWGAYMTVNSDGTFEYNYHDADYDMFYICHAQGTFGNVSKIDEFTYKVQILEMTFEYEVDSEWTVTENDGSVINYTGADSYGLHQGDVLTYYVRGIDAELLPEGYLFWYCAPRALQDEDVPNPFNLSGYYNAVEEAAYIEDDYE